MLRSAESNQPLPNFYSECLEWPEWWLSVSHITERGIARQAVFTSDQSRHVYLALLKEHAQRQHLSILRYCLMTNHVHLLAVPERPQALANIVRYAHGRVAQYANAEQCRSGHFWQNRFYSCSVGEEAAGNVLAYIELNPVRAGLATSAGEFAWSSAAVHLGQRRDAAGILDLAWWGSPWTGAEWAAVLQKNQGEDESLRQATYVGRPFGSVDFLADLERRLNRKLQREKGGRFPLTSRGKHVNWSVCSELRVSASHAGLII